MIHTQGAATTETCLQIILLDHYARKGYTLIGGRIVLVSDNCSDQLKCATHFGAIDGWVNRLFHLAEPHLAAAEATAAAAKAKAAAKDAAAEAEAAALADDGALLQKMLDNNNFMDLIPHAGNQDEFPPLPEEEWMREHGFV